MSEFPYVWYWNRMGRKGERCRVVCRGRMNSALLEFEDGFRAVTSRSGLRRAAPIDRSGGSRVSPPLERKLLEEAHLVSGRARRFDVSGRLVCPSCGWRWPHAPEDDTCHVVPRDDVTGHDTDSTECVCGPTVERVERDQGDGWLVIHHALDGREKGER